MAVTEGRIPVSDTGKDLDTTVVEQTDGSPVHREAVVIADAEDLEGRAKVRKGSDQVYRVEVQLPPAVVGELTGINQKLEMIEFLLKGLAS